MLVAFVFGFAVVALASLLVAKDALAGADAAEAAGREGAKAFAVALVLLADADAPFAALALALALLAATGVAFLKKENRLPCFILLLEALSLPTAAPVGFDIDAGRFGAILSLSLSVLENKCDECNLFGIQKQCNAPLVLLIHIVGWNNERLADAEIYRGGWSF